jgi:hypothetical protein
LIAYKFLEAGAVGPFTGFHWPRDAWVEAPVPLELCGSGVHACDGDALCEWLSAELWTVELGGKVLNGDGVLVAERGRLVEHVAGWNPDSEREFAVACTARIRDRAEADKQFRPFAEGVQRAIDRAANPRLGAVVSYAGRHVAELAEPGGWERERMWQSAEIRRLAGL